MRKTTTTPPTTPTPTPAATRRRRRSTATAPTAPAPAPTDHTPTTTTHTPAAIAAALSLPNPGDLDAIPAHIQPRALHWLTLYASGLHYKPAMIAARIQCYELQQARRTSKTFATLSEDLRTARRTSAAAEIEETMQQLAAGQFTDANGDQLPPDTRAAALVLQATDDAYRPGTTAPCTAIQINVQF